MADRYTDVFIRKNLNDAGNVPSDGGTTGCPDIIPVGLQPVDDPVKKFTDNWSQDPGQDLVANGRNFIYVRGKNLGTTTRSADFVLNYTKATLVPYPDQWLQNTLKTSSGAEKVTVKDIPADGIAVIDDPFTWVPEMIANDHYCLVARIGTADHDIPVPKVSDMKNLGLFLANHPTIGWRNIRVVDAGVTFETTVDYTQGSVGGLVYVFLECTDLPAGSQVCFASGTPLPDGGYIKMDWTTIPQPPAGKSPYTQIFGSTFQVPAGWKSNISYSYKSNGHEPGDAFKVNLKAAFWVPPQDCDKAVRAAALKSPHTDEKLRMLHHVMLSANPTVEPGLFLGIGEHSTVHQR
ncbi:hypothetical protein GGQ74_003134 [Desulfobaculum xiamenense]|uniref:Uncharacterized protein n=1 Tax=Desulfobaculum xiamenense TaxID=995050 RepID=A0A846QSB7_9BACT|nr:hypothetical protein [Desulfobaculum xiamenense]NJB69432.1 hypothetical protein [Desulfobaculum xiamenense]